MFAAYTPGTVRSGEVDKVELRVGEVGSITDCTAVKRLDFGFLGRASKREISLSIQGERKDLSTEEQEEIEKGCQHQEPDTSRARDEGKSITDPGHSR